MTVAVFHNSPLAPVFSGFATSGTCAALVLERDGCGEFSDATDGPEGVRYAPRRAILEGDLE